MSWTEFKPFTDYIDIKPFTGHQGSARDWQAKLTSSKLQYFSQSEGCSPVKGGVFDYKRRHDSGEPCNITCGIYFIRVDDKSAKKNKKETPSGYYDYIGLSANFKKRAFQSGIYGRLFEHYRKLVCLPPRGNFGELITKYQLGVDLSHLNKDERGKVIQKKYKTKAIAHLKKQHFKNYDQLRDYFGASYIDKDLNLFETTKHFYKVYQECKQRNDLNSIEGINKFFKNNVKLAFYEHNFSGDSRFVFKKNGQPKITKKDGTSQINDKWTKFVEFISKGEGVALAAYKNKYGKLSFLNNRDEIKEVDNLP